MKTHEDPMQVNKGQRGPMQAYEGMEGCIGLEMQHRYVFSFLYILTSYKRPFRQTQAHNDPQRLTKANTGQKKNKKHVYDCLYMHFLCFFFFFFEISFYLRHMYENLYMCFIWFNFFIHLKCVYEQLYMQFLCFKI